MKRTLCMCLLVLSGGCASKTLTTKPNTPTSSATTASTTAPKAHLGSAITLKGQNAGNSLDVTAMKVVDPAAPDNEFEKPKGRFVAVQFKLVNTGAGAYDDAPGNDGKVIDADGQSFQPTFSSTTAGPEFAGNHVTIAPGDTASGWLTFDVPVGAAVAKVQFALSSGFGNSGQWLVP